ASKQRSRAWWIAGLAGFVFGFGVVAEHADQDRPRLTSVAKQTEDVPSVTAAAKVRDARVGVPIVAGALRLEGIAEDHDKHPLGGVTVTLGGARSAITELDGGF